MSKNHEGAYFLPTPRLVPLPSIAEHYTTTSRDHDIITEKYPLNNNQIHNQMNMNMNISESDFTLQNVQLPIQINQVI